MTMTDFLDYPGASTEKKITSSQVIRFSTHVTETQSSSKENLKLSLSFFFFFLIAPEINISENQNQNVIAWIIELQ